jgi:putative Mg2+ transporter-C (MgtC) family protein
MPVNLSWSDIAIRLLCTVIAGGLLCWSRTEHGRAAGLRTMILVSVAAAPAMIQVNLLLPVAGRSASSFVTLDLMRLPLGILSGIGFIGAGAVVRRGSFVLGLTTAATIWLSTVIGLCFGAGQLALGLAGLVIGITALEGLTFLESRMKRDHQGRLTIRTDSSGPGEDEIRGILENGGFAIASCAFATSSDDQYRELRCDLEWHAQARPSTVPEVVRTLADREGIIRVAWTPES